MNTPDLIEAHKHASHHRDEVLQSYICGCFHCLAIFHALEITIWWDCPKGTPDHRRNQAGRTATCPECGIDSVLGSDSGLPITPEFLSAMRQRWFEN